LGITTLSAGGWHTLGLTKSGKVIFYFDLLSFQVYVWGLRVQGNLGQGGQGGGHIPTPTVITGLEHVIVSKLFTGSYSANNLVQTIDGACYIWGSNRNGMAGALADSSDCIDVPTECKALYKAHLQSVHLGNNESVIILSVMKDFVIKNRKYFCDVDLFFQI
jgi:alpha-tubulin suppressor-like RCC1 family protein